MKNNKISKLFMAAGLSLLVACSSENKDNNIQGKFLADKEISQNSGNAVSDARAAEEILVSLKKAELNFDNENDSKLKLYFFKDSDQFYGSIDYSETVDGPNYRYVVHSAYVSDGIRSVKSTPEGVDIEFDVKGYSQKGYYDGSATLSLKLTKDSKPKITSAELHVKTFIMKKPKILTSHAQRIK